MIVVQDPVNVDRLMAAWLLSRYGGLSDVPIMFLAHASAIQPTMSISASIDLAVHQTGVQVFHGPYAAEKVWSVFRTEVPMDHLIPLLADAQCGEPFHLAEKMQGYFRTMRPVGEIIARIFEHMDILDGTLRQDVNQRSS